MKNYCLHLVFVFLMFTFSCRRDNEKIEWRFRELQKRINTKETKLLLINLDGCPSCYVVFQDFAKHFLDSGVVVLVSKNSKKANAFLDLSHPNVFYDRKNISSELKLANDLPTEYQINPDNSIDSLIVGF
ncbi:hypothetical protein [Cognataquiflexum aquatile]|uniref:hypothetical protein n=1 Tax=Cognataquiflexum aquatile TaxID=2249427 RepID=UPI0013008281|nr:hypothetical protein [Cognataquiflexum aquatile]